MAVNDSSRLAVGEGLPDERQGTALGFLHQPVRGLQRRSALRPPVARVPPADKHVRFQS